MADGPESVVYVEDEEDIRVIGKLALESVGGIRCETVADGAEAVAVVKRTRPELVLLDVMMPGMDGPATLAALRADSATASVPVAFMTAKTRTDEIERLLELGAIGVIPKPFDPMTLADQVRRLWADR